MRLFAHLAASAFAVSQLGEVWGHGDGHAKADDETVLEYAKKHMAKEHHIDDFDLKSFFSLHDLDRNGKLDGSEIEAIYGMHHTLAQRHSPDEATHDAKAKKIVGEVLAKMDKDGDGLIDMEEFEAAGLEGLPDYTKLGAEGHHYDEESEFFLHHEEEYHNTPDTQTDEAYVHEEDVEHFKQHERIELEEENKERVFQGLPELTMEEARQLHEEEDKKREEAAAAKAAAAPKISRPAAPDPRENLKGAVLEAIERNEKYGGEAGEEGAFARPRTPADRLKKNVPYKYKFRRNWGDF